MIFFKAPDDSGEDGGNEGDSGTDATSGTVGSGNEDRLALMDRINNQNDRDNADQLALVNDDGSTEPFVLDEPGNEDPDKPVAVEPALAAPVPPPAPKIKVDGQEVELTPELIAKAQKIASADKYLQEAAEARKTATPTPPAATTDVTPPKDAPVDRSEDDRALVRAIQMGTEEEAIAALRKVREGGAVGLKPEDVARIADERLSFNTALDWFNGEYKDLVSDPVLHGIVMERDSALVQAGDKRSYRDRYEAVGNEVREWMKERAKQFAPAAPAPTVDPLKDKEDRKAAVPSTPRAASGKAQPAATEDDSDEDPSVVIAKMREQRGGPQWSRA
jgi:hypothetical protein